MAPIRFTRAGDQLTPLPDTPPRILIGFVWDWHHRTDAGLTAKPGKQSAQQQLRIDAGRFGAAHAPVHRYTRRLDDVHLYVMRYEPSRQPKPAPSGLVAGDHAPDRATSGSSSGSIAINRHQQIIFIRLDSRFALVCERPGTCAANTQLLLLNSIARTSV